MAVLKTEGSSSYRPAQPFSRPIYRPAPTQPGSGMGSGVRSFLELNKNLTFGSRLASNLMSQPGFAQDKSGLFDLPNTQSAREFLLGKMYGTSGRDGSSYSPMSQRLDATLLGKSDGMRGVETQRRYNLRGLGLTAPTDLGGQKLEVKKEDEDWLKAHGAGTALRYPYSWYYPSAPPESVLRQMGLPTPPWSSAYRPPGQNPPPSNPPPSNPPPSNPPPSNPPPSGGPLQQTTYNGQQGVMVPGYGFFFDNRDGTPGLPPWLRYDPATGKLYNINASNPNLPWQVPANWSGDGYFWRVAGQTPGSPAPVSGRGSAEQLPLTTYQGQRGVMIPGVGFFTNNFDGTPGLPEWLGWNGQYLYNRSNGPGTRWIPPAGWTQPYFTPVR